MADSLMRIIITAIDNASATLKKIADSADNLGVATGETAGQTKSFGNIFKQLTGITVPGAISIVAAGTALKKMGEYMAESADYARDYGVEVNKVNYLLGTSGVESSKIIELADDLGIEQSQLTMALRMAQKDGIQPNIDGLRQLADQYRALNGPVERSQFLMETFGARSGTAMARVLALGSEGIDKMVQNVEGSGKVISTFDTIVADNARIADDALQDAGEGLKLIVGQAILPATTKWKNAISGIVSPLMRNREAHMELAEAALMTTDSYDEFIQSVTEGSPYVATYTKMGYDLSTSQGIVANMMRDKFTPAIYEQAAAYAELIRVQEAVADGTVKMTVAQQINAAAPDKLTTWISGYANLRDQIAIVAAGGGQSLDILTKKLEELEVINPILAEQYQRQLVPAIMKIGITAGQMSTENAVQQMVNLGWSSEDAAADIQAVGDAAALINGMVSTVTIVINKVYTSSFDAAVAGVGAKTLKGGGSVHIPGLQSGGPAENAVGGPVRGGSSYLVGELGPEVFVPNESGNIIAKNRLGGGGTTINITFKDMTLIGDQSEIEWKLKPAMINVLRDVMPGARVL